MKPRTISNKLEKDAKIYIAGHRGMVGSAIVRELNNKGFSNIVTRTSKELDLRSQEAVREFYKNEHLQFRIDNLLISDGVYTSVYVYNIIVIETT